MFAQICEHAFNYSVLCHVICLLQTLLAILVLVLGRFTNDVGFKYSPKMLQILGASLTQYLSRISPLWYITLYLYFPFLDISLCFEAYVQYVSAYLGWVGLGPPLPSSGCFEMDRSGLLDWKSHVWCKSEAILSCVLSPAGTTHPTDASPLQKQWQY